MALKRLFKRTRSFVEYIAVECPDDEPLAQTAAMAAEKPNDAFVIKERYITGLDFIIEGPADIINDAVRATPEEAEPPVPVQEEPSAPAVEAAPEQDSTSQSQPAVDDKKTQKGK